jgi:UDPglucose--hexose-1-phosphate uridylyltransferase
MGHHSSYEESKREDFARLTEVFLHTLRRLDVVLGCPPFNYMLHTSPFTERVNDYYHWHIEIIPRLTRVAGFEWGSDFYINSTSPEDAAEYLRQDTTVDSGE